MFGRIILNACFTIEECVEEFARATFGGRARIRLPHEIMSFVISIEITTEVTSSTIYEKRVFNGGGEEGGGGEPFRR